VPVIFLNLFSNNYDPVQVGTLLDSGSHRSFISAALCSKIKHKVISSKHYSITGFNGNKLSGPMDEIECTFFDQVNQKPVVLRFLKLDDLCQHIPNKFKDENFKIDRREIQICLPQKIEAIIGCDNFYKIVCSETLPIDKNLCALKTRCGWTILGVQEDCHTTPLHAFIAVENLPTFPEIALNEFWKSELLDREEELDIESSLDFKRAIQHASGRYEVSFLWKPAKIICNTYENTARQRLRFVLNKLIANNLLQEYDKIIKDYLANDIAEVVSDDEPIGPVRILPHHPVIRSDSTSTKVRSVLDASAKIGKNDLSLNDCLHEGKNFLSNLLGVLLRFRTGKFAMTSDITKAFLQLELNPRDRDAVRFFWFKEHLSNDLPKSPPILYRMKRLPFGIKSSPYLLCSTIREHLKKYAEEYPETVQCLNQNLYMDDFVFTTNKKEDALKLKEESCHILAEMKMELTKWTSNFQQSSAEFKKVLGVSWNNVSDEIKVSFHCKTPITTKRELASFVCSVWDPFGLLSPVLLNFKLYLQQIWRLKLDWDEKLPDKLINLINQHTSNNPDSIFLNRCIISCYPVELHCYVDASSVAYGACLYVKQFNKIGKRLSSNLLIAKSRLAPINGSTIPRLELQAALIGAKLVALAQTELGKNFPVKIFSDSQVVLHWICSTNKIWKTYVQRRVEQIRELTDPHAWEYIPSASNPADVVSRGTTFSELLKFSLWWGSIPENSDCIKTPFNKSELTEISCTAVSMGQREPFILLERFSSWCKAIRVAAYALRFINKCRKVSHFEEEFSVAELNIAENKIIENVQSIYFPLEIQSLKGNQEIQKSSQIYQLNPFFDKKDGLIKVNSRLENSYLPLSEIYPIILPEDPQLDRIVILSYHKSLLHSGISTTLSELRKKYWLCKGRKRVKKVNKSCNLCKRKTSITCQERWASLPKERVNTLDVRPFNFVGIDFFGPIHSKDGKIYVLLITCLQIRAIHLEITTSLETSQCLNALSRFICRRGIPKVIFSDNATTFKAAQPVVHSVYGTSWKFIVERSPSKGGAWERLVQSVKVPLRIVLRSQILPILQLQTWLCKVESVVNLRPLTYISDSCDDLRPITPFDFLNPPSSSTENQPTFCSHHNLVQSFFAKDKILESFFTRWKEEYLKERITTGKRVEGRTLKVGDIVLIDDGKKKEFWPLARIISVNKGRDDRIRSCSLNCKGKVIRRGIDRVYFLDLAGECVEKQKFD